MIQELTRIKMAENFYAEWAAEKLHRLTTIAKLAFKDSNKKPKWKLNGYQIPRLVKKNEAKKEHRPITYKSWDEYFHKQREIVNTFLNSGDLKPFCTELWFFVREIVNDKKTDYVLKKWLFLILDIINTTTPVS
jgi:hypothetical protein